MRTFSGSKQVNFEQIKFMKCIIICGCNFLALFISKINFLSYLYIKLLRDCAINLRKHQTNWSFITSVVNVYMLYYKVSLQKLTHAMGKYDQSMCMQN